VLAAITRFLNTMFMTKNRLSVMQVSILLIILMFCNKPFAQNKIKNDSSKYIVAGIVYDSTLKSALPNASLKLGSRNILTTENNGRFKLVLPTKYSKKKFSITASYYGYKENKIWIDNRNSKLTTEIAIYLTAANIDPNKVVIIR
jgi:hypothetical protein